ncbi:MAG: hypothetical protein Q4D17_07865, partial [Planctomycetia bacterium]|nr:hypothetical protein [Planctomycetia bacterium]
MKRRNYIQILMFAVCTVFFSINAYASSTNKIMCEGTYGGHLQGLDNDGASIFWAFTTELVKTDGDGKVLKKVEVPNHHGDLCCHNGVVFVAV